MKKAFLLCATHNDLGTINALKKLGYYIVVSGCINNLPGEKYCDKFIFGDYSDKELMLQIAKTENVDVVIQCCNDYGVYTAAYIAEKLGLPGYDSYETTLILHNKDLFKKFAKENDILAIDSVSFSDIDDACMYIQDINYPIIIKPVDCSAGKGINRADTVEEALLAIKCAFGFSRNGRIVIEPFISGTQHGFCTFLINKKVVGVSTNDEFSFENPYRVEIDTFPASNKDIVTPTLIAQIEKMALKLNLCDGIFHIQYIYDGQSPRIIECMRRILGNMYHIPGNMSCNVDYEYWETRARCGLSLEQFPVNYHQEGFYSYKTILADRDGVIESIQIPREYERYIVREYMLKGVGDRIDSHLTTPVGFLFMRFSEEDEMMEVLIDNYRNDFVCIKQEESNEL